MYSQDEVEALFNKAQESVDALAENVDALVSAAATAQATQAVRPRSAQAPSADAPRTQRPRRPSRPNGHAPANKDLQRILKIQVPVVVRLANRPYQVGHILRLTTGTILEFDRPVTAPLDLMVNNCVIGKGVAVRVGENFGLQIKAIQTPRQRIQSLVTP